ncbi:MAG TPA: TIM barrel protein [Solirubrobacteraceae bacterium]|jgi:sugar phosphate isomerase/epimerase/SAM-dependent methyltransferase|nr:TIM barrel protein [Solirubrobacteraceae bacterium]
MATDLPAGIELAAVGDEAAPDIAGQVATVRALGWAGIELRTVDAVQIADLSNDAFDAVAVAVATAGLRTVALASRIGGWGRSTSTPLELDVSELDTLAPRAHALGTRYVRIMSFANDGLAEAAWRDEALRRVEALAARALELGIVLLHENCAGWAGQGPDQTIDLLTSVDSPALRVLFDIGNCVAYGHDPVEYLAAVMPWVAHVHVKDAVREGDDVRWVHPGAGQARVADCLTMLVAAGYRGCWAIEPHLQVAPHRGEYDAGAAGREAMLEHGRLLARMAAEVAGGHPIRRRALALRDEGCGFPPATDPSAQATIRLTPAGSYVLFGNASEDARRRLKSIEAVWDEGTRQLLLDIGVRRGWRCLEVGAGAGSVARWLADVVGPTGEVVATDIDTNFLTPDRHHNLRVLEHDIVSDDLPGGGFDVVHARMVLQHLPGRERAMRRMLGALAPGGWLLLEDSDWTTLFRSEPPQPDLDALKPVLERVMTKAGFDTTQGIRNLAALDALGMDDISAIGRSRLMRAGSPGVEWYSVWIGRVREALVNEGIEDDLVERALRHFQTSDVAWMSQTLIATRGRKRPIHIRES